MEIKTLAWDSEFFEKKIGEVSLKNGQTVSPDLSFDVLYVKNDVDFTLDIEGFTEGFYEAKVVFSKSLAPRETDASNVVKDTDFDFLAQDIYELAFESGKFSRFSLDRHFGDGLFQKLYKAWIDNSLNRKLADAVLLYVENDLVWGFVTYRKHSNYAHIGLIAADPRFQGKGIGTMLLAKAEQLLFEEGIRELRIPTQLANIAACSFYTKNGYTISETTHLKHYWNAQKISND
jgi:dTDP-4-amino-4,6-dideoxy-D-galactose acyltransferase